MKTPSDWSSDFVSQTIKSLQLTGLILMGLMVVVLGLPPLNMRQEKAEKQEMGQL
jgi:hypothetical protein